MRTTQRNDERILQSDIFDRETQRVPRVDHGTWHEQGRAIPIYHRCDVLVVGGGPSGTAAAAAAAREGSDVTLLERYNHLGGLSTGGLVIWIDRMSDWQGRRVIRGFAEELFDRLPPDAIAGPERSEWGSQDPQQNAHWAQRTASYHGVVTWSPTIDPERLKLLSQEIVLERQVKLVYHSWVALPIVQDGAVSGVVFESKEGRMAIMAKVVVDATGDGDLFGRAGAQFENDIEEADVHHAMNTAWLFGGVDMNRWIAFRAGQPEQCAAFMVRGREECGLFERPFVSWRNDIALFMGPRQTGYSGLDVDDLTAVEVRSRRAMEQHLNYYRAHAPGFENAFMMLSAPQIGVRHTRRLKGVGAVLRSQWPDGLALPDEIGVSPAVSPKFPNISIPYGALVPAKLDGLLACGRHVSCDRNSHGFMREIPQCWITGQAAGVAAALSVSQDVPPRGVDVAALQNALLGQGVYLRPTRGASALVQASEDTTEPLGT
jgi:2-polyprenyl-6-methoxyphenol hydroxylase-like FAD-dependent oxidoreductase